MSAHELEKSRKELADEYERVQKKAFTNWINSHLLKAGQKVDDLYVDFRNGQKLLLLLELLTDVKLPREKGKMRFHQLQNVNNALDFLQKDRKIKLVNIRSEEIVDGNPKLILGLVWTLILHFQISDGIGLSPEDRPTSPQAISTKDLKDKLLEWAQKSTEGYESVRLTNFDKSWRDGMGFCAIINRHRPDLLDFDDCDVDTPLENLELAFSVAEKELGIFRIVDPEDLYVPKPDDKAVLTYVSYLHHAFPDMPPPHWKKKPKVSLEDFMALYDTTREWIVEKTKQSRGREFPNTVEKMKAYMAEFDKSVTKELPRRRRDLSALSELSQKLKEQKKTTIPTEYEYAPLEEAWAGLQKESADCKKAMEAELKRLEDLDSLADQILSDCKEVESGLKRLEDQVSDFEQSSMSMAPEEASRLTEQITSEVAALEAMLDQQTPRVQQLKDGHYDYTEPIETRVDSLRSRLASLPPRLEQVSSAMDEAEIQVVAALESKLEDLEFWLVSSGKFSNNQHILVQIEDHKVFQQNQLSAAQERVLHINSSSHPPSLDDKVKEVNQRFERIVKQTKDRLAGLEPIVQTVREFDSVSEPVVSWSFAARESYDQLKPLEVTVEQLEKQKDELLEIRKDIAAQEEAVEKTQELAEQFFQDTEPVQSMADRYARKLRNSERVAQVLSNRGSEDLEEASISEQAEALQSQWASLNSRADDRARLIDNLIDMMSRFDEQYNVLREFVEKGTQLLASEKPVGESGSRLKEQMDTCQEFRAEIVTKQPAVDAMLALGRAVLAEPHTTSQNDALMNKLTTFISDWSDIQLAWQNWYDELHACVQQSQDLSNQFDEFQSAVSSLGPLCSNLFPANLSMDGLPQKLHSLQTRFGAEVLVPYRETRSAYEHLKSKTESLPDNNSAEKTFKIFEDIAITIERHRDELAGVVTDVDSWWGELEGSSEWLLGTERSLTEEKPLASSEDLLVEQKRKIKSVSVDVEGHESGVERVLRCLGELASHESLLQPSPVVSHKEQLKTQWNSLCNEVQERGELCTTGKDQLASYADGSLIFNSWLKQAEERQKDFSSLPRNKEDLKRRQEEVREFHVDISAHSEPLDQVETNGSNFLSSAKAYQSLLVSYRQGVDPEDSVKQLEWFVKSDESLTQLPSPPTFHEDQYENGIRVVAAHSSSLRGRYDALHGSASEFKGLVEEAVIRREEFDSSLDSFQGTLSEIERKCGETEEQPMRVQERVEAVRSLEVECLALEPQLQTIASAYDLLVDLDEGRELWEGEDEALRGKEEAERRHRELLDRLRGQRESLNADLSDVQAFFGSFEGFLTWLREKERKIQRDDPLKLEETDLDTGLAHLKGVASDIAAHQVAYQTLCSKAGELVERGVQDSEELRQNLDNMEQRWNAIQIVTDDIEVIEETIPKLKAFNQSYSQVLSTGEDLLAKITGFSVSAISSDGLEVKGQKLQDFSGEISTKRGEFESLLESCELFDTPFDTTKFQADVGTLKDKLTHCDKAIASKRGDLKTLGKKVRPMEDLFQKFRLWLKETESQLASLSPPSTEDPDRARQLQQAKVIVENVEAHQEDLEAVKDSVSILLPLLDGPDQQALKGQLDSLTGQYDNLKFSCELYTVERWLEDRSRQLGGMAPTGVTVPTLQEQLSAAQEFQKKSVGAFKPRLESLASVATQADHTGQPDPAASSKMKEVESHYDNLRDLAEERLGMLSGYLPDVQRYESSRVAWETLLCGWEERAGGLPSPGATPESIQAQIDEIKFLQQAITDHEPEFVSLRRELGTLCQGPATEPAFFDHLSEKLQVSSGRERQRPGQQTQEDINNDYQQRLEALKRRLESDCSELGSRLEQSTQFRGDMAELSGWLEEVLGRMDELVIRDPKRVALEEQHSKCKNMLEGLSSQQDTKDKLLLLCTQLTSGLPDISDERPLLQAQLDELNTKWSNLSDQLRQHQSCLDAALPLAESHEGCVERLVPWVPNTLERLESMGPPPSEPNLVEQLKTEIESLKAEYNTLAPVYSACVEDGQSLSSKCEEGKPRSELDSGVKALQDQWEKLNSLFGDILQKLTDALVQTQEFQGIADGLDRWMDAMGNTLRQQKRIAARVRLVDPQVEGFRHILSDIAAYSARVEQAKTLGRSLIDESKPEESQKVSGRLEALATQFRQLESAAQTRMSRLEGSLKCASVYEDKGTEFNDWLFKAEDRLGSMEQLAIASQPLKKQLEGIKAFSQDVEAHSSDVSEIVKAEEDLFDTELPTIQLCEEHLAKPDDERKLVLPDWLERPGAPEAVKIGVDLRNRYDQLQVTVGQHADEATQLLASVLAFEADYDTFNEWLSGEVGAVGSLPSPAVTVEELKDQLAQVENIQRDFKNQEDSLESLNAIGTTLIDSCKAELSQSSARLKLSDVNETWGDALAALATREETLKKGLSLAETYKGFYDSFDEWLADCEEKTGQPLKLDGDPKALKKQLEQLKALEEAIGKHKSELKNVVDAGHKLEKHTEADPSPRPDIGYTALEDRYLALKIKVSERASKVEEALGQASDVREQLEDLLKQLEKLRTQLANHRPPRAQSSQIEKQIKDLLETEGVFTGLQPKVEAAKKECTPFASLDTTATPPPEGVPSGADILQLLTDLDRANDKVEGLLKQWQEQLAASLNTAKKFEEDHKALLDWTTGKEAELRAADTVRGIPEGVEEQLQQVEAVQVELNQWKSDVGGITALGQSLTAKCSPEDATLVKDKLSQLNSALEGVQRSVDTRRRVVEDGLANALAFLAAWNDAMGAIADKKAELEELGTVGGDIDTVKAQLEEYKEFEASLAKLKPKVTKALELGKHLKDSCSSLDESHISGQLEQLSTAWSQLNSDSLARKHKLEDGLLQLGQFQDALGELMAWIVNCTEKVSDAPLPGVKVGSVEAQLRDLQAIESGISSHAPSVASLSSAGKKLGTTSSNTADIQQDLETLNSKWDELKSLTAARSAALQDALPRAQTFKDSWKKELNWLTDAENKAYADWKPCGLPETCQEDIDNHKSFTAEVESHEEPISKLKAEGEALKKQGSLEDQRVVDRWLGDIVKRYEDLKFSMDEKEAQMSYAKERADEFDQSYSELRAKVAAEEDEADKQGTIRSEVEAVKQQMEDHKEFMKVLGELEGQLEDLDGWGQLLSKDCVKPDGETIQGRVEDLKSRLEALVSAASDRQTSLEESLLSLGEFEEAYDELWAWLLEALQQLEEAEPITGDPDTVAAQLSRHKALQKQLGARLASKNAVSRAGKLLMKHKTGEDKTVLKRKLQDLEREWEKACQVSVDRQDKLENAYREIAEFRSYVGPLLSWTAKVLPTLDESEPVHGDLHTVNSLLATHGALQRDLGAYQESADEANAIGGHLVADVLDDPSVTEQDLNELNKSWDNVCQRAVAKQEQLEEAYKAAKEFADEYGELAGWIDEQAAQLLALPPPNEDSTVLQQQIDEHKELSQSVTTRQPDFDKVLGDGQGLLQVAHPKAVPVLQNKLQELERKWVDLRGRIGARSEALASALLELHGLQDMLDKLWGWVSEAETTIKETELVPIGNNLETVEQQLADHEAFQEEMATQQPNMDALNKAAKKRKSAHPHANPEMTKKISSLYKRWQKLWLKSSERHRQLLEAKTRLNDIALARSFDFDKWRKRFTTWVDQQKLRVSDLFRRFDSNHDGMLTREEFMKALRASGLAMTQIELEKIADSFDKDHTGMIDLNAILGVLKGSSRRRTRPLVHEALTDSDKIENEIQHQLSKCTCTNKFLVTRVAEGQYRFGDNQKLRLVRILRSTVMVRVGGGWEPLEEFLAKHDPCRGRTNEQLRGLLGAKPGLATAGFTTKRGTQIAAKNEATRRSAMGSSAKVSTRTLPSGRKETTLSAKKPRDTTTPTRETKPRLPASGRSTPVGRGTTGEASHIKRVSAARHQSPGPRPTTPSSARTSIRPTTPSSSRTTGVKTSPRHTSSTLTTSKSPTPKSSPKHNPLATPPSTATPSGGARKGSRIPTPKSKIPRPS